MVKTKKDIYIALDDAIDKYTRKSISKVRFLSIIGYISFFIKVRFLSIIDELNKNEFGIKINKDLVKDYESDFNEEGYISYDSYEEESSYDDDH